MVGEAIVAYEHVDEGSKVDHNTFANISMGAFYYYTANNLQITNNVFYKLELGDKPDMMLVSIQLLMLTVMQ